ncbi:uncharacterized protein LOC141691485 [Apium graveolens]|uniref:uncharacterized protein LOC141691485 n=1 Tax=Apium graveolens TaxID=4045 RepID=UPI003D7ACECD
MLSKPLDGENLILYLAVSEYSISAVLVREEDGQQSPVYYVSKRLHDAETRYTNMEKLVYALILASRKLRPYFQAHRVEVRTAYPLRQVLHKPESSGAGIVLVSPEGHHLMSAIHFKFYATNNDAEYEALINGLKIALEMGVRNLIARSDSELVVNQVNGGFQARGPRTELYLRCTHRLIGMFKKVRLECFSWEKNNNADALAKMGSQQEAVLLGSIPLEIQEGTLPEDKFMARQLRYQAARYVIYDEVLYKRGFNQPLLRFGIPYKLVSDNRKQFDSKELRQLCEELKIKKEFAAVYHPQTMVPVEVGSGSLRRDCYRKEDAEINQRLHLDLLEETRENSQLRLAAYQQRAARYYNKKGTYHLEDMDGKLVPRAWNAEHLRKYYQ